MYLYADKYVGGWNHSSLESKGEYASILEATGFPVDRVAEHSPSLEVKVCVGYWRKVNAIHSWFVRNVQNGVDDCGYHYVPRESLLDLKTDVREAYADRSSTVLEPVSGFFFGSYEKDRWYYSGLKYTSLLIDELLGDERLKDWDFYYHSSW